MRFSCPNLFSTKQILLGALVLLLLLPAAMVFTAIFSENMEGENDQCIRCHAQKWNQGMALVYQHLPFLNKQCVQCHLDRGQASENGSQENSAASGAALGFFTGSEVNQEPLFRKKIAVASTTGFATDHEARLDRLELHKTYRFRLILDEMHAEPGTGKRVGNWLGLLPAEVPEAEADLFSASLGNLGEGLAMGVSSLSFARMGDSAISVSWQTAAMSRGWVELEEMEGIGMEATQPLEQAQALRIAEVGEELHPRLRDAEEMAIDHCLTCHPKGNLGFSHPVRVYATSKHIAIPDDLPTIKGGMMTCVTCHDPHSAPGKQLIRESIKTKLCVACHTEFKGRSKATMF